MSSLAVASDKPEVFEMESCKDAMELFKELGYTKEKQAAGIHDVYRVYLQNKASYWRGK